MLRIHFTAEDLARTTLAAEPDPLWEVLLSLHMLQVEDGPLAYGAWRQRLRRRLPRETVGALTALAPPVGYSPDFLTPTAKTAEFGDAVNLILSTPRQRLRADLSKLSTRRTAANWVRQLAEAQPETLHRLGHSVRVYHRAALAEYWPSLRSAVQLDNRQRMQQLTNAGVASMLVGLHPEARWRGQVLEIAAFPDEELRLKGRGLRLQPSYFCWKAPTKLLDADLPPVLVFPIRHASGLLHRDKSGADTQERLAALVGRTRAAVLSLTVEGSTTTQLARSCDITLATASHQTAVLRDAGLIVSQRQGKSVIHQATTLGQALLDGTDPWSGDTELHESHLPSTGSHRGP
ncbi:helix-turn-helix domain-containing protein [Streptomyces sp. SID13031]|uniref:ArsR/SmtB family transcription factor n=1 Tax=Streptomyces sp. SID13031 TaxID=2706046 RepID=UPI0013C60630|nr:helix-turn-helix domain-containing protein [Streptomyces sp. SID13031]NEA32242.1 winged helix-turn-helix transcriptional regulator [Streptomyces sp. SID13031]